MLLHGFGDGLGFGSTCPILVKRPLIWMMKLQSFCILVITSVHEHQLQVEDKLEYFIETIRREKIHRFTRSQHSHGNNVSIHKANGWDLIWSIAIGILSRIWFAWLRLWEEVTTLYDLKCYTPRHGLDLCRIIFHLAATSIRDWETLSSISPPSPLSCIAKIFPHSIT